MGHQLIWFLFLFHENEQFQHLKIVGGFIQCSVGSTYCTWPWGQEDIKKDASLSSFEFSDVFHPKYICCWSWSSSCGHDKMPPFTTWHIVECYQSKRNPPEFWFSVLVSDKWVTEILSSCAHVPLSKSFSAMMLRTLIKCAWSLLRLHSDWQMGDPEWAARPRWTTSNTTRRRWNCWWMCMPRLGAGRW